MTDERILSTEEMIGSGHASKTDTLNRMSLTGHLNTGHQLWAKGGDRASASALSLGNDGNYFDVTGTTTITSIGTKGIGFVAVLHFDGVVTLTHHATNLILPKGNNIKTAAGDEFIFIEYAIGNWRLVA